MVTCANCGYEGEREFTFCPQCGQRRVAPAPARELRKTVTVLFCDMTGSTAVGESVDPETLRAVLNRYFRRVRGIIETHGGTVEKFAGDAVMAVFGVPVLHEDDALRAVRAAADIRDALPELDVNARIGVNTGEVVTGTEERLAAGDAVNVAARLEQTASAGEVLLGAETLRRVRGAVEVAEVPPLSLKGKSEPVEAYRLVAVRDAPGRRFDTPMVGRERELRGLREAFGRAEHDRSCQLFTILGTAGVGKSRLAAEFTSGIDARVMRGRCLSYGKGITYWPLIEAVRHLDALPADETVSTPLRSLLGESEAATSAEEIAWAFRKLLEHEAREAPVVCVLDDLHWAEDTFLDLVEHVADLARGAPILLLCIARPELLDARPGWAGGKWNATTVLLEPLDAAETGRLLDALGGVDEQLRERILAAAEGNPLYLEEMVALVRESGGAEVVVPPTIQALLAARLDQLDTAERSVLERGAVEGRIFHRSALEALDGAEPDLSERLVSLIRKELVRPEPAAAPGDEAYRFRHLLIRDAAYDALPKAVRAELHERFATWVDERRAGSGELDEIVGHHLEQAAAYSEQLGRPDAALAERAGTRLGEAGRRALWRGDVVAAAALLGRALTLLEASRLDVALALDFAQVQPTPSEAAAAARAAAERAEAAGDEPGAAAARVAASFHGLLGGESSPDELAGLIDAALPILEEADDHAGLALVWSARGYGVANVLGRYGEWAHAAEQAILHARLAGQRRADLFSLEIALVFGPTPADEAVRTLDAVLPDVPHPHPVLARSHLLAMLGQFDEAWPPAHEASERLRELTGGADPAEYALAEIAALTGDYEAAAAYLRGVCDFLEAHGQRGLLSTFAPMLGRHLCALGRYDEAEPQARVGRELGEEHDVATQALWRQVQARVDSSRGEHQNAEALAREAVELVEQTDALNFQGGALHDLGDVLGAAGRTEEAIAALEQALDRYERKKNLAAAAQIRAHVESVRSRTLQV